MQLHHSAQRSVVIGSIAAIGTAGLLLPIGPPSAAAEQVAAPLNLKDSRVFIVGDSLTVGSAASLRSRLKGHVRSVQIDAEVGRHTATGIAKLRSSAASRSARIWIVALGTNDDPSSAQTKRNVTRVLKLAGKDREVIWVNVVRPGGYARVNRALNQLDTRTVNLTVIDWAGVIRKRRELLSGDRVHLTPSGYRLRAIVTRDAVLALGTGTAA